MATIRHVEELTSVDRPAWPRLRALIEASGTPVTVLPVDRRDGERTIHRLQVTARSTLGAVALNTGGLLVDHGWLRVLGGGGHGIPDLAEANALDEPVPGRPAPDALAVAFDILGGRFALNGGNLPGDVGGVCYWGPDTLEWTALGMGHGAFLQWALGGGLERFYSELRWQDWQDEVAAVKLDEGLACFPFLFSAEGRDIASTMRTPVPFSELMLSHDDLARQIADVQPAGQQAQPGPPLQPSLAEQAAANGPPKPALHRPWRENRLQRDYSLPRDHRLARQYRFKP